MQPKNHPAKFAISKLKLIVGIIVIFGVGGSCFAAIKLIPTHQSAQTKASTTLSAPIATNASLKHTPSPSPSPSPTPTAKPTVKAPAPAKPTASAVPTTAPVVRVARRSIHTGIAAGSALSALSPTDLAARLDGIKALGVGWVRYDIEWENIEQQGPGQFDWSAYDRVVSAAASRGLSSVGVIDYAPTWARNTACAGSFACEPADPNAYGQFAGLVASRYKSYGVHTWEIWNEPNSAQYFQPGSDPATYTAMLKSAYAAIKQSDPSATVLTGGLSPADTGGGSTSPPDFLTAIYANSGGGSFDALGDHPYTFPVTASYPSSTNAWGQLTTLHNLMASHGDGAKQIWITEYGAPTGGPGPTATTNSYNVAASHVTEALQSQSVSDLAAQYLTYSWLGPVFWYSYQDAGTSQNTNENFFGLIRADGSHKPAYDAFVQAVATIN